MKKIVLMIVAVLMTGTANAQLDSTAVKRKKVGVVLSGGGAKGMAHIGVLKVLEKAGIPVDIVTGTSIGSIVGGLYAIGYNAHSLDSMVRTQDWTYVITDKEDLRKQSLLDRKKQNTYLFNTGLTIGKRDMSAGGLIRGKNLAELFQKLFVGYTDSLDFNKDLKIPFACVATNIMDNSEVVFHSGRLPQAIRASMSIPAAFSPVRMGDMVLVDGGLKNNFPVDVARQMGAEVVIGITLNGKPKTAEDITGTMKIVGQIIDVNCVNKYDENKALSDLWMNVDPHGYSTASFTAEAIDSLVRYGEEEAMRHWDEIIALKKLIGIDDSFRPTIYYPLRPNAMTERQHIVGFTFENMTPQAERFLRNKFHLNKVDSIDAKLEQELTTSMRMDLFYQTAECQLIPQAGGVRVVLSAGERKSLQFHAGVRYDNPDYYKMERKFRDERQINYFDLPQKVSQWVLKDVQSDWRAFVKLIVWKRSLPESDPRKQQEISPPHYKYKDGHARLRYTKQAFSLKAVPGKIVPSGTDTALEIPKFVNPYRITQLVIEPEGDRHMRITFIYKVDLCDMLVDNGKVAGADLGVTNLVTIGTNVGRGIIVDGKPLKSVNQWYNKRMAELRALNDILYEKELKRKVETQRHRKTAKMERLSRNRRNWIKNYLHWASRRIIDFIASAGITTLVVGKNVGWKQECGMNKVNTQNFVQIPHARLIDMLSYKARQLGIACLTTEESYTRDPHQGIRHKGPFPHAQ